MPPEENAPATQIAASEHSSEQPPLRLGDADRQASYDTNDGDWTPASRAGDWTTVSNVSVGADALEPGQLVRAGVGAEFSDGSGSGGSGSGVVPSGGDGGAGGAVEPVVNLTVSIPGVTPMLSIVERNRGALSQTATRGTSVCLLAGSGVPKWSLGPRRLLLRRRRVDRDRGRG